jgi:hypothetical protein
VELAQQFLADHVDSFDHKTQPNERTLGGHADASPRGIKEWEWDPFDPGGAVPGKVTDSEMAASMVYSWQEYHADEKLLDNRFKVLREVQMTRWFLASLVRQIQQVANRRTLVLDQVDRAARRLSWGRRLSSETDSLAKCAADYSLRKTTSYQVPRVGWW